MKNVEKQNGIREHPLLFCYTWNGFYTEIRKGRPLYKHETNPW
jgi:hypothetical protein